MKIPLNKKLTVGYIGKRSVLASFFVKKFNKKFIFKHFNGDIRDINKINVWLNSNKDINIFINFAAITSVEACQKYKKKALDVNYKSVVKLLDSIHKIKMNNFMYFLSLSTSHVFKKSKYKLTEDSSKKPINYYGFTKYNLEKYILKNKSKYEYRIGIARIFNYYNKGFKKGFFINDIIRKLKNNEKIIKFNNINTYRDYTSIENINNALFQMINLKLVNDYNICSGKKIHLPDIVTHFNSILKNKILKFDGAKSNNLVGSNRKLKKTGWKLIKQNIFN